jgi:predicted phosphoribosyltransferase
MRSSSGAARAAVVVGALAVAAIPVAVVLSQQLSGVTLIRTLYVGVPAACALGLIAVALSRRARFRLARSLHPERRGLVRAGRIVAWLGLYAGITGALALAVYGILRAAQ